MSDGTPRWPFAVATLFGVGDWRLAPGTWASLIAALPAWTLVAVGGRWVMLAVAVAVSALAIQASRLVCTATGERDPSWIVIDEVAGVAVAFSCCPQTVLGLASALLLFRVFDIVKPFPCGFVHRRLHHPAGLGVVLDDVLAAIWAGGVSWLTLVVPGMS